MSLILLVITFLILLFFTLILKRSLLVSAAVSLLTAVLMLVLTGGMGLRSIVGASVHGLLVAAEIGLLIFGALLFYNYLRQAGFIQELENALQQFSSNKLVTVILLAFFFGSFIEGVSGFGTPAMIFAPLLLGLRFPVYLAAALPLLANTVPVIFGAVGTPVKIGLADLPAGQIPVYGAMLMMMPAVAIPVICKRYLQAEGLLAKGPNYFLAIMAGVSFAIPFMLFAFLGPDFPSIAAPVAGLAAWLLLLKATGGSLAIVTNTTLANFYKTFKPYLFIALLLVAGKFLLGDIKLNIEYPAIQLKKSISLFQPGLIFIAGLLMLFAGNNGKVAISLKHIFRQTALRLPVTLATIACLAIVARLLSQDIDLENVLSAGNIPDPLFYTLPLASGFLGSFIAGSATVSNLMFGTEWYAVGERLHLNTPLLLAAQLAGAGLGNALSVQNIAMVQAVLNEKGLGQGIISKLWRPVLLIFLLTVITAVVLGYTTAL